MSPEIIRFTFDETSFINQAFEIRREVFVIEQNCPPEIEYENEETCIHYLAFWQHTPVATARWRITEKGIKLERFAVLKEFRRNKIASALVKRLLSDVRPFGKPIYLHAQVEAIPLYQGLGFVKTGPEFEEAGIRHFKMIYSPV